MLSFIQKDSILQLQLYIVRHIITAYWFLLKQQDLDTVIIIKVSGFHTFALF